MPVLSKKEGITYLLIFRDQEKKERNVLVAFLLNVSRVHTKNPTYPKSNTIILVDKDGL